MTHLFSPLYCFLASPLDRVSNSVSAHKGMLVEAARPRVYLSLDFPRAPSTKKVSRGREGGGLGCLVSCPVLEISSSVALNVAMSFDRLLMQGYDSSFHLLPREPLVKGCTGQRRRSVRLDGWLSSD
jgi:hypothetical protein